MINRIWLKPISQQACWAHTPICGCFLLTQTCHWDRQTQYLSEPMLWFCDLWSKSHYAKQKTMKKSSTHPSHHRSNIPSQKSQSYAQEIHTTRKELTEAGVMMLTISPFDIPTQTLKQIETRQMIVGCWKESRQSSSLQLITNAECFVHC